MADEDPFLMVFTSGTTGRPKGEVLTHADCFWTNLSLDGALPVTSDDVVLQVLPQFHVGGWNVQRLLALWDEPALRGCRGGAGCHPTCSTPGNGAQWQLHRGRTRRGGSPGPLLVRSRRRLHNRVVDGHGRRLDGALALWPVPAADMRTEERGDRLNPSLAEHERVVVDVFDGVGGQVRQFCLPVGDNFHWQQGGGPVEQVTWRPHESNLATHRH